MESGHTTGVVTPTALEWAGDRIQAASLRQPGRSLDADFDRSLASIQKVSLATVRQERISAPPESLAVQRLSRILRMISLYATPPRCRRGGDGCEAEDAGMLARYGPRHQPAP